MRREIKKDEKDGDWEQVRGWRRGRIRFRYTHTQTHKQRERGREVVLLQYIVSGSQVV